MKMYYKVVILCILAITLSGCNKKITNVYSTELKECNYKPQLLMTHDNRNIYTYCISEPKILINKKENGLKKYVKKDKKSIERIISSLELKETYYDGGTKIYEGDNIKLIECNTLEGNKDIYIGNKTMKYKSNFCKNDNYTFIRTYKINSIKEYKEQQYENGIPVTYANSFEVVLTQNDDKKETVILNNIWNITLEENKIYEFEFMLYENKDIDDNIKSIFKNSDIVDIRLTNKIADEQIQEEIKKD